MKKIILTLLYIIGLISIVKSQNINYYIEYSGSASASGIVGNESFAWTKTGGGNWTKSTISRFPISESNTILVNSQSVSNHQIIANPISSNYTTATDLRGNNYASFEINGPLTSVTLTRKYNASTSVNFSAHCLSDAFPLSSVPANIQVYLNPSTNIQSNNSSIKAEAQSIVASCSSVQCAVEEIAKWIRGNIQYHTANGFAQDAASVYSTRTITVGGVTKTGRFGNCSGYTNLTIAMLRSIGIPARYLSGIILPKQYTIPYGTGGSVTVGGSGPGLHAVHEIYYPSVNNWVRGDAQAEVNFGSTNFVKMDHGTDTEETGIKMTYSYTGTQPVLSRTESLNSTIGSVTPNYAYIDRSTFGGTNNGDVLLAGVITEGNLKSACSIPVGIWDKVEITNATETFMPGLSVSYSAGFTSGGGDTWPVGWNWYMRLYYEGGTYELAKNENSSSYWSFTTNSSLPNYQWVRDPNGNIYGEVSVVVQINDGDWKSDNIPISVQYKPNQPIVNIASYINSGNPLNNSLTFSIDSKGSDTYKVYYSSSNTAHQGISPISVTNGDAVTLSNLNYFDEFWVTGVNSQGESTISNKIPVAKYFSLPLTYTRTGDQNLCVTKYESSDDVEITFNSDGSIILDNDGWHLFNYSGGADFHLNLNNEKDVYIEFDWYHYDDEFQDEDGLYLSVNGGGIIKKNKIFTLNPNAYQKNVFHHFKLNLSILASNAGLVLSKASVLRLSHEDNNNIPDDGFVFKNIKFYSSYAPPSPFRSLTLGAEKDALLCLNTNPGYEYVASTNYGSYSMIKADEWTHSGYRTNSKSIFDFDLSRFPENAVIKSAKISLYANNPQPDDNYKQMTQYSTGNSGYKSNASWLQKVVEPWDENVVTYNSCPQTTNLNGEYLPVSETYTQDYLSIDVTNVVKDMIANPSSSFGFMLNLDKAIRYTRMAFASSDNTNSSLHPKLTIEHYLNEQVQTIPFTVSGSTNSESNNWDVQGGDGKDKAYLVYVPTTITFDASTCSSSTNYDTKLEIFRANKTTTGYYNDDYSCSYSGLTSSLIGKTLTPGYYYFVVDGYNGAVGNFKLTVSVNSTLKSATLNEDNLSEKIEDNPESMEVLVYPNPVCDDLHVVLPEENTLIKIVDLNGKVLKTLKCANTNISINCSDLLQGVYVIQVKTSKSVEVRLFVKQ